MCASHYGLHKFSRLLVTDIFIQAGRFRRENDDGFVHSRGRIEGLPSRFSPCFISRYASISASIVSDSLCANEDEMVDFPQALHHDFSPSLSPYYTIASHSPGKRYRRTTFLLMLYIHIHTSRRSFVPAIIPDSDAGVLSVFPSHLH